LEQERRFGKIAHTHQESVAFTTEGITFRLHGVVDRVDKEGEQVHIVDYKSGNAKYNEADIMGGRALQVALYALAMEQMDYQVASSRYLHIRKRVESGVLVFEGRVGDDSTVQAALTRVAAFIQDIREGRFPAAPADVTKTARACRDHCPFAVMCRVNRTSIEKGAALVGEAHE
jgi:RecB family exonuclease